MTDLETPSQTIGPFFTILLPLAEGGPSGDLITVTGRVIDGGGENVADALIEAWTSDGEFARSFTSAEGFRLNIRRPVSAAEGRAPVIEAGLFARGLLRRAVTRIYLGDEERNAGDPVLQTVPQERRQTLMAHSTGPNEYRFDIYLQGPDETAFFDV